MPNSVFGNKVEVSMFSGRGPPLSATKRISLAPISNTNVTPSRVYLPTFKIEKPSNTITYWSRVCVTLPAMLGDFLAFSLTLGGLFSHKGFSIGFNFAGFKSYFSTAFEMSLSRTTNGESRKWGNSGGMGEFREENPTSKMKILHFPTKHY